MMKRPVSPEEAASETEQLWLSRSQESQREWTLCGWCRFDGVLMKRHGGEGCDHCPVRRVFGCYCGNISELCEWHAAPSQLMQHAASDVYELAVKMRIALIAEAYEILRELGY